MSGTPTHTPGPWTVAPGYDGDFHDIDAPSVRSLICSVEGAADAALISAAPDLLAACEAAALWLGPFTTERYDAAAEQFYRETRYMAPGKSVPLAMNPGEQWEREREPAWRAWCGKRIEAAQESLRAAIAKAKGVSGG